MEILRYGSTALPLRVFETVLLHCEQHLEPSTKRDVYLKPDKPSQQHSKANSKLISRLQDDMSSSTLRTSCGERPTSPDARIEGEGQEPCLHECGKKDSLPIVFSPFILNICCSSTFAILKHQRVRHVETSPAFAAFSLVSLVA